MALRTYPQRRCHVTDPDTNPTSGLRLTRPTDISILRTVSDGKRYTAPLVSDLLDADSSYVSSQMGQLQRQGLLTDVHSVKRCRLYTISPKGIAALAHEDVYETTQTVQFQRLTWLIADALYRLKESDLPSDVTVQDWHPNMIMLTDATHMFLREIRDKQPLIPGAIDLHGFDFTDIVDHLYELTYYGLITRDSDHIELTELGETVVDLRAAGSLGPTLLLDDLTAFVEGNELLRKEGGNVPPDWFEPSVHIQRLNLENSPPTLEYQ